MVYTFKPYSLAISAAITGSTAGRLFLPSVNKIITRLFALLCFNRLIDVAKPTPIPVPSSITVSSYFMVFSDSKSMVLSDVTGVRV